MEQNPTSSIAADRKTIEKNRRNHMRSLYSKLHSLLPRHNSSMEEMKPLTDQLDEAARYIKKLRTKLEKLNHKREGLKCENEEAMTQANYLKSAPQVDIHEAGSSLEINLIADVNVSSSMFNGILRMLQEEGAEILNANCLVNNNTSFYTIHSKVGDCSTPSCGNGRRISERISKFVSDLQ